MLLVRLHLYGCGWGLASSVGGRPVTQIGSRTPIRRQRLARRDDARHGALRLATRHGLPAPDLATLAADLDRLSEEQAACWNARSRPGGLTDSLARLPR